MCAEAARGIFSLRPAVVAGPKGRMIMSAEKNLRIVQDMYAAFARGDVGFVVEQIDEACDGFGVISATRTGAPWHVSTDMKGKAGAMRYFESLAGIEHVAFEQRDFAAMGEQVYATLRLVLRDKKTGKTIEQPEVVHHFTFKNGKVARVRVLEDTAATRAAYAGA
jgi:ketosteroid isomerase-like protein